MNRYIRSQVILNTNNKKFHQILQLTNERVIFASKSDAEKWLILNHRNSPDICSSIKNNNVMMYKFYYENKIININILNFDWIKIIIDKIDSGIWSEKIQYFTFHNRDYDYIILIIAYFGNLRMFKTHLILGGNYDENMLYFVIYMNHTHILKYIDLSKCGSPSYSKLMMHSCRIHNFTMFKLFYKKFEKEELYLVKNDQNSDKLMSYFNDKNGCKKMYKKILKKYV